MHILFRFPRSATAAWLIGFLLLGGCSSSSRDAGQAFDLTRAKYVGQAACVRCHQEEAKLHTGSHHDQAMQLATEANVLGDFNDATIEHHGIVSRLFRRGDQYLVHTEGPDGSMQDFEIKYVFGVEPLQQYMVEFPAPGPSGDTSSGPQAAAIPGTTGETNIPRVQVLRLCWDTNRQEWFYLPPPDVPEKLEPTDDLHWTGVAQRWNNMCADCHSTDFRKNFEPPNPSLTAAALPATPAGEPLTPAFHGQYHSSFIEINVSCEACHGPGSVHIELAEQWFPGWNRQRGYGLANLKATAENQIQACAPCHSRRSVVQGGFRAGDNYYDFYTNQLLIEGIYYPDGQILDEDYVHGSFIQSKMYHKGIRCTDCHDPHTARLKHDGNHVCTSCHQHPAAKYDSVAHHFHKPGSEGAQCVNCHMPTTTYMAVDARRDHSLRVPRPDLSLQTGSPNACAGCHLNPENISPEKVAKLPLYQDWMQAARDGDEEVQAELQRANQWCDAACEKWYGADRRRDAHFGLAIAAGQSGAPDAVPQLVEVLRKKGFEAPALARATALQVLSQVDPEVAAGEAVRAMDDEHPLVRTAAVSALLGNPSRSQSVSLLQSALSDPVRSVRTEAARNLLEYPDLWNMASSSTHRSAMKQALAELTAGLEFNNDRAGAHMALATLAEQQGRNQQAIKHYQTAILVEPTVAGPRTNLAALLERNLESQPQQSGSSAASSPLQAEIDRLRKEELPLLERDARLLPTAAPIQYRLGLALYIDGQAERAVEHLVEAARLEPEQAGYAQMVALLYESLERWDEAIKWAETAVRLADGDPQGRLLLERIRQAQRGSE